MSKNITTLQDLETESEVLCIKMKDFKNEQKIVENAMAKAYSRIAKENAETRIANDKVEFLERENKRIKEGYEKIKRELEENKRQQSAMRKVQNFDLKGQTPNGIDEKQVQETSDQIYKENKKSFEEWKKNHEYIL